MWLPRRRVATFEQPDTRTDGYGGYIDPLWKGIMLVEHKSRGRYLDRDFQQARGYFPGLKDRYPATSFFGAKMEREHEEATVAFVGTTIAISARYVLLAHVVFLLTSDK